MVCPRNGRTPRKGAGRGRNRRRIKAELVIVIILDNQSLVGSRPLQQGDAPGEGGKFLDRAGHEWQRTAGQGATDQFRRQVQNAVAEA